MIRKLFIFSLSVVSSTQLFGQKDSGDVFTPNVNTFNYQSFTYRKIVQEYMTNENGYYLGVLNDTTYIHFKRLKEPRVFEVSVSADEAGLKPAPKQDTLHRIKPIVEFNDQGGVESLQNWKQFRDLLVSLYSAQAASKIISSSEFDEMKDYANKEENIRRMMMEDLQYVFALSDDTFTYGVEYLRVKAIRSPFSGNEMFIEGNLKISRPAGTRNTIMFDAQNLAGPVEKKVLMEEAVEYVRKNTPAGELVTEVTGVGLNSEQQYQYNTAQKHMIQVRLSDVVVVGNSSRGNIRTFYLWDVKP